MNVIRAVLRVAVLAALGRLLLPADFGLVAAAGVVIWFCNIFSSLGVGPALVQRPELEQRHVRTGFASSLGLGLGLAGIIWIAAPAIAHGFRMPDLVPLLRVLSLALPISALSVVGESLLQRDLRFGTIARIELVAYGVGYALVGIGLAIAGAGVWALVAAELAKSGIKSALFLRAAAHPLRPQFDGAAFGELVRFGSGYTATSLSMYFALQGDNLVVARALGAAALGLYGRAYELMLIPAKALGDMLMKVLFPTLSRLQGEPERLGAAYRRGTAVTALIVLPVSAATIVLAPEIVLTLLGGRWIDAAGPLRVLAAAMYFQLGYMVGHAVTTAAGAVYRTAWRSVVYAGLVVAGALAGQRFGLTGVAAGVAFAIAVNFFLIADLAGRLTGHGVRSQLSVHGPALVVTALVAGVSSLSASMLRSRGLPAPAVLFVTAAIAGIVILALIRLTRGRIIGDDGIWFVGSLRSHAPGRLGRLLGWAVNTPQAEGQSDARVG